MPEQAGNFDAVGEAFGIGLPHRAAKRPDQFGRRNRAAQFSPGDDSFCLAQRKHGQIEFAVAEQGEDAVTEVYGKALETYLPTSIREILTAQEAHIELVHEFLRTERDAPTARVKTAGSTVPASREVSQ